MLHETKMRDDTKTQPADLIQCPGPGRCRKPQRLFSFFFLMKVRFGRRAAGRASMPAGPDVQRKVVCCASHSSCHTSATVPANHAQGGGADTAPMGRHSHEPGGCLVPSDYFFEWPRIAGRRRHGRCRITITLFPAPAEKVPPSAHPAALRGYTATPRPQNSRGLARTSPALRSFAPCVQPSASRYFGAAF
jgi:hypothetical protein